MRISILPTLIACCGAALLGNPSSDSPLLEFYDRWSSQKILQLIDRDAIPVISQPPRIFFTHELDNLRVKPSRRLDFDVLMRSAESPNSSDLELIRTFLKRSWDEFQNDPSLGCVGPRIKSFFTAEGLKLLVERRVTEDELLAGKLTDFELGNTLEASKITPYLGDAAEVPEWNKFILGALMRKVWSSGVGIRNAQEVHKLYQSIKAYFDELRKDSAQYDTEEDFVGESSIQHSLAKWHGSGAEGEGNAHESFSVELARLFGPETIERLTKENIKGEDVYSGKVGLLKLASLMGGEKQLWQAAKIVAHARFGAVGPELDTAITAIREKLEVLADSMGTGVGNLLQGVTPVIGGDNLDDIGRALDMDLSGFSPGAQADLAEYVAYQTLKGSLAPLLDRFLRMEGPSMSGKSRSPGSEDDSISDFDAQLRQKRDGNRVDTRRGTSPLSSSLSRVAHRGDSKKLRGTAGSKDGSEVDGEAQLRKKHDGNRVDTRRGTSPLPSSHPRAARRRVHKKIRSTAGSEDGSEDDSRAHLRQKREGYGVNNGSGRTLEGS